jgi:hypothetical protein
MQDSGDADLAAAREARQRAKSRAQVVAELAGNDADIAQDEYVELAGKTAATQELDGLLNWGDEPVKEEVAPAKLPE